LTQLPICSNWLLADFPMNVTAIRMMNAKTTSAPRIDARTIAMVRPAED